MLVAALIKSVSVWAIIPEPQSYVRSASSFIFTPKTIWAVENDEQAELASLLVKQIEKCSGFSMGIIPNDRASKNVVRFITDETMRDEQYQLIVDSRAISIIASSRKGFFNALQSLRQLLPAEIESAQPAGVIEVVAQGGIIKDNPYLEIRAIRLKKQNTSLSKEDMFKFIDLMGLHKLNRLYWDPIDENGMPFDKDALHEIGAFASLHCIELSSEEANIDEQMTNPNLDNTIILEPEEVECTLKDIYMYKPGSGLRYSNQLQGMIGNILGGESNMTIYDAWRAFPNGAAFADICWSGNKEKNWKQFLRNLDILIPVYKAMRIDYSKLMYELNYQTTVKDRKVQLRIHTVRPDIDIRYTTGGETPTRSSSLLSNPIMITENKKIFAIGFQENAEMSDPLFLDFQFNKATAKPIFSPKTKKPFILADGLSSFADEMDGWVYFPDNKAIMTIDLLENTPINKIAFGVIGGKKAEILVSQDGAHFSPVKTIQLNNEQERFEVNKLGANGRFVKLIIYAEDIETTPLRMDEIVIL